jgi:hypothetical protein
MRTALLVSITVLACYWIDAYCYYGEYARGADAAACHVANAIVTVIRNSIGMSASHPLTAAYAYHAARSVNPARGGTLRRASPQNIVG